MARAPNYNQQRAERDRAKQAKADAKQRERDQRKAERDTTAVPADDGLPAADTEDQA
jgi:hypothetical protein